MTESAIIRGTVVSTSIDANGATVIVGDQLWRFIPTRGETVIERATKEKESK